MAASQDHDSSRNLAASTSTAPTEVVDPRAEWARDLRLRFCVRPQFPETATMLHADGSLNRGYFRIERTATKERTWTDRERDLLIAGIGTYGVGNYSAMTADLLPEWTSNDLRLKTMRLLGRQNLTRYKGWMGDAAAIEHEYERNHALGIELNCWRSGMLVADDDGALERALDVASSGNGAALSAKSPATS
ncbi:hypothetical protein CAOG_006331 [Capsaspora owczarzaki ATCC 30864]|uniref:Myb-like domain-containing protein n=2 Tax=Capsaspora owczarzaki (strain ATCC 30864) TaxID=595528 RepID=A0A0D2WTQ9_CAPO3|nr:hypothetical protein CAOG_006331 [Capsaspora owczarzaki ATCC 30864]